MIDLLVFTWVWCFRFCVLFNGLLELAIINSSNEPVIIPVIH